MLVLSDEELVDRMRAGDDRAFAELVERYHTRIVRLARSFVARRELAEDVAQETWIAVVRGVDRFEGRSSLRTWLFRICVNQARSTGKREQRIVPVDPSQPTVEPNRFGHNGEWVRPPAPWTDAVDDRMQAAALAPLAQRAIEDLPEPQRQVVTLRDAEGLSSREVCDVLSISEANQRVLLHRGRARVRSYLERELKGGDRAALSRRDLVCQQAVELVTDYLEGAALAPATTPLRSPPCAPAHTAGPTSTRSAPRSQRSDTSNPKTWTPPPRTTSSTSSGATNKSDVNQRCDTLSTASSSLPMWLRRLTG